MDFEDVQKRALAFRDEREWGQFHDPKDLAISISLEASELLENYQWTGPATNVPNKREEVCDELADVLIYCIYLADAVGADIPEMIDAKLERDAEKYPVEKSRGNATKYTEL